MPEEATSAYDVIVIGSGPAGATVAKCAAAAGKKVLILEWGPVQTMTGSFGTYLSRLLIPGKSLLFTEDLLAMVRGIIGGGSSIFYYGTAFKPPETMFSSRDVELSEDVSWARRKLPIGTLKDEMITPMSARIAEGASNAGFKWHRLDKLMYQDRWRASHRFGYYGDKHGVKWGAHMFLEDALRDKATLIDRAKVTKVLVEQGRAVGVRYRRKGKSYTASAELIVCSAGGISTPLILRSCGIKEAGYDFFFDPLITVCGTIKDVQTQHNEIPMSSGVHMEEDGYLMTDMPVLPATHLAFTAQVFRFSKLLAFRHTARIMIKAKDTLGGHITAKGGVRKKLAKEDKAKLLHGFENAKKILKKAGATDIYKTWYFAAHPGGTAKLGEIVDSDLQTRIENLYVCDCSVIPEAWGLPPTYTLVALGGYLSRRLGFLEENSAAQAKELNGGEIS